MNKTIIVILVVALVAMGVLFLRNRDTQVEAPTTPDIDETGVMDDELETLPADEPRDPFAPLETTEMEEAEVDEAVEVLEVQMSAGDFHFTPDTLTLAVGQPVRLVIETTGSHTFTIDELGVNETLTPGTNVVEFTPQIPGTFEFYCAVPGHRESGQVGTLTVTE